MLEDLQHECGVINHAFSDIMNIIFAHAENEQAPEQWYHMLCPLSSILSRAGSRKWGGSEAKYAAKSFVRFAGAIGAAHRIFEVIEKYTHEERVVYSTVMERILSILESPEIDYSEGRKAQECLRKSLYWARELWGGIKATLTEDPGVTQSESGKMVLRGRFWRHLEPTDPGYPSTAGTSGWSTLDCFEFAARLRVPCSGQQPSCSSRARRSIYVRQPDETYLPETTIGDTYEDCEACASRLSVPGGPSAISLC